MALIPPFFLDCVAAIGFDAPEGKCEYTATGFMYGRLLPPEGPESGYQVYRVTHKHVFREHGSAWIRLNPEADEPAREFVLSLVDGSGKETWRAHPDVEIDLAVVPINYLGLKNQGIHVSFFQSDEHVLTRKKWAELGASEGDGVYVLGFPMGLIGGERNYVIVRQGTIARIRDSLAGTSKDLLVDTSIFPGNSGGPVVTRPEIASIEGTKAIRAAHLVGVVSTYLTYQDVAISAQTKKPRIIFEENSGLATVVPADFIDDVVHELLQPKPEEEAKVEADENLQDGPKPAETP